MVHELAQALDGGVQEKADIGNGEAGDATDFFITEAVLKFEADDLALIVRELLQGAPDVLEHFIAAGVFARVGVPVIEPVEVLVVVGEADAVLAAQDIEGAVAADGVEPSLEVFANAVGVGEVKLEEGVLHHIAGAFFISTKDSAGVGNEIAFVQGEGFLNQLPCWVFAWL